MASGQPSFKPTLSQANPLSGNPLSGNPLSDQPSLWSTLSLVKPSSGQPSLRSSLSLANPLSGHPSLRQPSLRQPSQATLSHSGQQRPTLPLVNPFSGRSTHSNSRSSWNGSHRSCLLLLFIRHLIFVFPCVYQFYTRMTALVE